MNAAIINAATVITAHKHSLPKYALLIVSICRIQFDINRFMFVTKENPENCFIKWPKWHNAAISRSAKSVPGCSKQTLVKSITPHPFGAQFR